MKRSLVTPCHLILLVFSFTFISGCKKSETKTEPVDNPNPNVKYTPNQIYYYSYTSIDGKAVHLSDYKGKKIMFVNTASFCGNTPQYKKLEDLYQSNLSKLVIIGFPCNQFGTQEPGSDSTIEEFCTNTYNITFPLSSKIDVKGIHQDSIYMWLTRKEMNGVSSSTVAWNFQKYLVDEKGNFMQMFADSMEPDDPQIIDAINK